MKRIRPCDLQKLVNSLKLRKACKIYGIPNKCLRQLPRRPFVHLTHLTDHCLHISHFPMPWKDAKIITLPKQGKDSKFSQNLQHISLLSTTDKLFEKVILKTVQRHIGKIDLLNAGQFGFCARHSMTLQCMRLTDHTTLNFNDMSTAMVFLDIEIAFDTTWHAGLLYKKTKLRCLSLRANYTDRRLSAKLVPTFADRGCHVVSVTDPYGRILSFLDWSRYFFFQVAPQLYSRCRVDPVPDPLLIRTSASTGNRTQASGSVARNSHH
jgi:hypothetical protein